MSRSDRQRAVPPLQARSCQSTTSPGGARELLRERSSTLLAQKYAPTADESTPRKPPPQRTSTLGRMLQRTWRDQADSLYIVLDSALHDELTSIEPRFSHLKHENHTGAPVRAAEISYERATEALRAQDPFTTFDPTDPAAPLPFAIPARRLAREARNAWTNLEWVRGQANKFDTILDEAAQTKRTAIEDVQELLKQAHVLHLQFVAEALRRALRWRVLGRTVLVGMRWVNRVLGRPFQAN